MIKSEDFRRGNYVNDYKGIPYKIKSISKNLGFYRKWVNGCFIDNIYPIPLSEEILLKCGFVYNKIESIASLDDEDIDGFTHYWEKHYRQNNQFDSFTICLVKWGEQEYFTFSCHMMRVRLKYLHHLQNLIHSLTGEELNVEL
jgi:hypothetical protein